MAKKTGGFKKTVALLAESSSRLLRVLLSVCCPSAVRTRGPTGPPGAESHEPHTRRPLGEGADGTTGGRASRAPHQETNKEPLGEGADGTAGGRASQAPHQETNKEPLGEGADGTTGGRGSRAPHQETNKEPLGEGADGTTGAEGHEPHTRRYAKPSVLGSGRWDPDGRRSSEAKSGVKTLPVIEGLFSKQRFPQRQEALGLADASGLNPATPPSACPPGVGGAWIPPQSGRIPAASEGAPQVQRAEPRVPGGGVGRGRTCPGASEPGLSGASCTGSTGAAAVLRSACPGMCVNTEPCPSGSRAGGGL
ncbi:unnamed protein product [Boreogadus saida]